MTDYAVPIIILSLSFYLLYQIFRNAKLERSERYLTERLDKEQKTSNNLREELKKERLR
jgi:hypothetical protein